MHYQYSPLEKLLEHCVKKSWFDTHFSFYFKKSHNYFSIFILPLFIFFCCCCLVVLEPHPVMLKGCSLLYAQNLHLAGFGDHSLLCKSNALNTVLSHALHFCFEHYFWEVKLFFIIILNISISINWVITISIQIC